MAPMDLLDLHAGLLLLHLKIDKQCHRAAARIATLPPVHPLYKLARKCIAQVVKWHASPLHKLLNIYKIDPREAECIRPALCNPALTLKRLFMIHIPVDKEVSILEDKQALEKVKIYSDGSAHNGEVGAAAILMRDGEQMQKLHYHLSTSAQHMVHEAELIIILLGLHLIKTDKNQRTTYVIGVDNQATLSTLNGVIATSGQYITDKILDMVAQLKKSRNSPRYALKLRWTAGHSGIEGNEEVDEEAKKAVEGTTSSTKNLPLLLRKQVKINKSTMKQHKKAKLKMRWQCEWMISL